MNQAADQDPIQEFEAPQHVRVLVHAAMLRLGFRPDEAMAASRSGSLALEDLSIGLACASDGDDPADDGVDTLLVAADLGAGVLDTPEQRRAALLATTELMAFIGVALSRSRGQARLVSRWRIDGQSAHDLAAWLQDFARLGAAIVERQRTGASTLAS